MLKNAQKSSFFRINPLGQFRCEEGGEKELGGVVGEERQQREAEVVALGGDRCAAKNRSRHWDA